MSECEKDRLQLLQQRLQVLEDEAAIRNVIVRYGLAVDCGDAHTAMALHTEDCVYEVASPGSGRQDTEKHQENTLLLEGRTAIWEMVLGTGHQALLPDCAHTAGPVEVRVNGDSAEALGYSRLYVADGEQVKLLRLGFNRWQLRRGPAGWQIAWRSSRTIGSDGAQALLRDAMSDWDL